MFKYITDFTNLAHDIIDKYLKNKEIAIDCTLGNGFDTDFLAEKFNQVIAFDIQEEACTRYTMKEKSNVTVINDSHENILQHVYNNVDCIFYNLGFLPGGDKNITTEFKSTLISIDEGLKILNKGGFICITSYRGHDEGLYEYENVEKYLKELNKSKFGVMKHEVINRSNLSPILFVIEKK